MTKTNQDTEETPKFVRQIGDGTPKNEEKVTSGEEHKETSKKEEVKEVKEVK